MMAHVQLGNTVVFSRGKANRRSAPMVGVIDEVVSNTHAWVTSDAGMFLIRIKDCFALRCYVHDFGVDCNESTNM